jgi:N-acetylglucosaminyl-diphospho-decaprenol L-rhamnosyltransferase
MPDASGTDGWQAGPGEETRPGVEAVLAVIVVTWNSAAVIRPLLDSLPSGLEGLGWHLNVVDNDSADDTAALVGKWAAEHPQVRVRLVQTGYNAGYSIAINAGLAQAEPHTAALILNPDLRLHPGCARALLDALARRPRTGIVVPLLYDEHGELSKSLRREPSVLRALGEAVLGARGGRFSRFGEVILDDAYYRRSSVVDWATGAAMLISAECLAEAGPWDESFFLYSEETEFALRARDLGYVTRLAPEAAAMHIGGDSGVSPKLWTLLTLNRVRFYRRRHSLPAAVAYWSAALLREVPRAALGHPRSRSAARALLSPARFRAIPAPRPEGSRATTSATLPPAR